MCAAKVSVETLKAVEPIGSLPDARLSELAGLCQLETVSRNSDPFLVRTVAGQAVYLLRGELMLTYPDGSSKVLVGAPTDRGTRSLIAAKPSPAPRRSPRWSCFVSTMTCSMS